MPKSPPVTSDKTSQLLRHYKRANLRYHAVAPLECDRRNLSSLHSAVCLHKASCGAEGVT
jgi:hypothetical protein